MDETLHRFFQTQAGAQATFVSSINIHLSASKSIKINDRIPSLTKSVRDQELTQRTTNKDEGRPIPDLPVLLVSQYKKKVKFRY